MVPNEYAKRMRRIHRLMLDGIVGLSPAYDLLYTIIVLDRPVEDVALPIDGRAKTSLVSCL